MNLITKLSLVLFFSAIGWQLNAQKGYNIRVKIDDYKNDTCMLGYRMGDKTYVKDTLVGRNKKGEFVFKGDKPLTGGIYMIVTYPDNKYFEFLIGNEKDQLSMVISTKKDDVEGMNKHLKITGSEDNKTFLAYLNFLTGIRDDNAKVQDEINVAKEAKEDAKVKELEAKLKTINDGVLTYQNDIIKKHPDFLCAKLIGASKQPVVPKEIEKDRTKAFYYYRAHYWDNFDWSDERLINTPILLEKIKFYTEKLTVQVPDSVVRNTDYILQSAKKGGNKEVFKYVAAHLLNKYAKSKVICMDAVYVSIGEKYYCNGDASWVDSAQLVKICDNVQTLKPLLCNKPAPNITLRDIETGQPTSLYNIKAPFLAVYFWDPGCGNCTKTTAKLVPVYNKYKDKGFQIYGVCSDTWKDIGKCKDKIKEKKMDWMNLTDDAYPLAYAKKYFDIKMNPYMILLDKDKKILWKRIDPGQLDGILKREFELLEKEKNAVDKDK
ncbi:MAG: DUF5106 domain-containing protein [Aureispira sp.]|nr:DUF5106 domain-containing protein [Aureispira sp.]